MITINEIDNRENLQPQDYEVLDYLDNHPPRYYPGTSAEEFAAERRQWELGFERYLGPDFRGKICNCHHCGNGTVRYLAVCVHKPSGRNLIFGSECVFKLGFEDRKQLVLAQIKARAEQGHARLKAWKARCEFLDLHPALKEVIDNKVAERPVHAGNEFLRDLLTKFDRYGYLSESQIEWVFKAIARDVERAERKQRDAEEKVKLVASGVKAPEGRVAIRGEVLHTRTQESNFGLQYKWLVKIEAGPHAGTKVWSTIPNSLLNEGEEALRGKRVEFTATFERKADDPTFAFGGRPSKAKVLA